MHTFMVFALRMRELARFLTSFSDLPLSFSAILVHWLPIFLWYSRRSSSSSSVQGRWEMAGLRWLYHLGGWRNQRGHVPLSALLSTTSRDGFGNSAPLSGTLLRDEEAEGLVLLVGPLVHDLALLLENGSGVLRELKRLFVFCHWLDDGLIFHLQKCL